MIARPIRVPCMDEEEWRGWAEHNATMPGPPALKADIPCRDCTPEFAAEMRAAGRCEYRPMTTGGRLFARDGECLAKEHFGRPSWLVVRRRAQWRAYGQAKRARAAV